MQPITTSRTPVMFWHTESSQKPPRHAVFADRLSAGALLKAARDHTATVWTGDFHQAKQVLAALKKRVRSPAKPPAATATDIQTAFHRHRLRQAQQSRLINMLAVEILPDFRLCLPRAPDVRAALTDVFASPNREPFLLPLNQLLGFIGAHEWHKKGVFVDALNARIHVPFGVFSPLRGEYLALAADAPLPGGVQTAFDIGTGSGVLAAVLAKRGVARISATDNNPRAIACARANFARLGLNRITLLQTDLFPDGRADLIVCNPPWLPAKPTSAVETALYDPDSAMLRAFLKQAAQHLNPNGEIWLIMSDLAEHLGLRAPDELNRLFQAAGFSVKGRLNARPTHAKAAAADDPLAFARRRETTTLYRLQPVSPFQPPEAV
ncbi:class I SAM-dependent methyltransferase [Neisseria leonii]|uniref:Class I SAM-dependent methyltransferase n=1 Tax=Neisseria leonii TaxID=2995413 RepID=A0A9X4E2I1_9NEIS|nr:class I SAM-dependent methyltransferase [Neisseria sp. 51.81]MDD9328387.1 class I SAM-dependent methyltransferase [Neisseria sp. 51.81]